MPWSAVFFAHEGCPSLAALAIYALVVVVGGGGGGGALASGWLAAALVCIVF